jgi:hypothetical protein
MFDVTPASNSVIEGGKKKNCTRYKWSSWGISSSAFMIKFAYSSSLPQRLSGGLKKLEEG